MMYNRTSVFFLLVKLNKNRGALDGIEVLQHYSAVKEEISHLLINQGNYDQIQ